MSKLKMVTLSAIALLMMIPGLVFGEDKEKPGSEPLDPKVKVQISVEKINQEVNKVTLSLEKKPTAGYGIQIERIDFKDNDAVIYYRVFMPADDQLHAAVITEPRAVTYLASTYTPKLKVATSYDNGNIVPGSSAKGASPQLPNDNILEGKIRGKITNIEEMNTLAYPSVSNPDFPVTDSDPGRAVTNKQKFVQFYVEAQANSGSVADKALVRVNASTKIFKQKGKELITATVQELQKGTEVEVIFVGPMPDTFPIQGNAGKIIIL